MDLIVTAPGTAHWRNRTFRCALGRSGITRNKYEGDGATPAGRFSMRRVFYRPDRIAAPASGLPATPLDDTMGWCDDPEDAAYNHPVHLPYPGRHERLWRTDGLYDIVVVIGYNDDPVIAGAGSAIFLHVAAPDFAPTEGCVALAREDLQEVLTDADETTSIEITPP